MSPWYGFIILNRTLTQYATHSYIHASNSKVLYKSACFSFTIIMCCYNTSGDNNHPVAFSDTGSVNNIFVAFSDTDDVNNYPVVFSDTDGVNNVFVAVSGTDGVNSIFVAF